MFSSGRIKALLLRPKMTTAAPVSAPLRQATAAAAIDGRNRKSIFINLSIAPFSIAAIT